MKTLDLHKVSMQGSFYDSISPVQDLYTSQYRTPDRIPKCELFPNMYRNSRLNFFVEGMGVYRNDTHMSTQAIIINEIRATIEK